MRIHHPGIQRAHALKTFTWLAALLCGMVWMAAPAFAAGDCPQPRKTKTAPGQYLNKDIPNSASADRGEKLYRKSAKPMACKMCHGDKGDGQGQLGKALKPAPRNFTCNETMQDVTPGQMFWVIKNGSPGTGMVAHNKTLDDKEIWDVVKYIQTELMK